MQVDSSSSKRKMKNYDWYRITGNSTNGRYRTNIPSYSSPNSSTESPENNGSPNSTCDRDITMSASKKAMSRRQHSKPATVCLN